jgi:acyl-CoA synthetase (AMP-forming)/AMP-acid ligase II
MTTLGRLIRKQATMHPTRTALTGAGKVHSYSSLERVANKVANGLLAANVGAGDRVAYGSKDSVEFLEVLFGVADIGAGDTMPRSSTMRAPAARTT